VASSVRTPEDEVSDCFADFDWDNFLCNSSSSASSRLLRLYGTNSRTGPVCHFTKPQIRHLTCQLTHNGWMTYTGWSKKRTPSLFIQFYPVLG